MTSLEDLRRRLRECWERKDINGVRRVLVEITDAALQHDEPGTDAVTLLVFWNDRYKSKEFDGVMNAAFTTREEALSKGLDKAKQNLDKSEQQLDTRKAWVERLKLITEIQALRRNHALLTNQQIEEKRRELVQTVAEANELEPNLHSRLEEFRKRV